MKKKDFLKEKSKFITPPPHLNVTATSNSSFGTNTTDNNTACSERTCTGNVTPTWLQLMKLFYHYTIAAQVLALMHHITRKISVSNAPCVARALQYLSQVFCKNGRGSYEVLLGISVT